MNKLYIKGEIGEVSDGHHTFNELYEHRCTLFLVVLNQNREKSWISKLHDDGSGFDGWFIAGIETEQGDATYHLPDNMWDLAVKTGAKVLEKSPPWDGHTSKDVVSRLKSLI